MYVDGEFNQALYKEDIDRDREGARLAFYYLRSAQHLTTVLWGVKDNNVYVRDGFLLIDYDNEDGLLYKASLSAVFTKADGSDEQCRFTNSEIATAIQNYAPWPNDGSDFEDLSKSSFEQFYKNSGSTRLSRAAYFIINARNNSSLAMKLLSYCTALECLFTTGTSEVSHKIAERVAVMLGVSGEEKKTLFKLVKKAYGNRSKIVHGSSLKGSEESLIKLSVGLDEILRKLILAEHEIFTEKDEELDSFFEDLLFTDTL